MRIPISFLQTFFSRKLDPVRVANMLTSAGLEVEHINLPKPFGEQVVVGKVLSVAKHPHADRLRVCQVDCGKAENFSIVCGAPNVAEGQRVVVALPGAELPNGMTIQETTIRGEMSHGMICAEDELGIGDSHKGILVLPKDATVGARADTIGLTDALLEAEVTPNRPDWLSIRGIARELAALFGQTLVLDLPKVAESGSRIVDMFKIRVATACASQYHLRLISLVAEGETPHSIRRQLQAYGLSSQHPAVDVTNFVLFEYGQPLHAFDADTISGKTISVRFAKRGERFDALDGTTYSLSQDDIVIADAKKVLALAGIIGGSASAVTKSTKRILLESAIFPQKKIRHTSRRLGIRTEAANRFERGVSQDVPLAASARAAVLLSEITGAKTHRGVLSFVAKQKPVAPIVVTSEFCNALLGTQLQVPVMAAYLARLGFLVRSQATTMRVVVPPWRHDVLAQADVAEEVARMYGYTKLPLTLPRITQHVPSVDPTIAFIEVIQKALLRIGYSEVTLESWYGEEGTAHATLPKQEHCEIQNPLQKEQRYLRTDLLPGLLAISRLHRKQVPHVKLFECGQIFWKRLKPPAKDWRVGFVVSMASRSSWIEAEQDMSQFLKAVLHCDERDIYLGAGSMSRDIRIGTNPIGHMVLKPLAKGALAACLEFDVQELLALAKPFRMPTLTRFPSSYRDFAVSVPTSMDSFTLLRQLRHASHLITSCELFDVMPQEGTMSYAFHLAFTANDRTLTSDEVDVELQSIRRACAEKGITVRS